MTREELIATRRNLGLTQSQLAEILGYRPKTISDYERGAKKITKSFIKHMLLVKSMVEIHDIVKKNLPTP